MNADQFRRLALSCPGAAEGQHMGHPDFRANGRIFATLDDDETIGMVKLPGERQDKVVQEHPEIFSPCKGAWGAAGATRVQIGAASVRILRPIMAAACAQVAQAKPPRRKPTRPTPRKRT